MSVLVQENVNRTLLRMALPMLAGTFAMNAYNLTDAYFVSQLGTLPLAAVGFIGPVIMLLTFIAGGIGTGTMTLMSHAIGRHDHPAAAKLVTHGMLLTVATTITLAIIGYLNIDRIFTLLGADDKTLPLIHQFMSIWFLGALTMSLPMTGNGILISAGDSKHASALMIFGAVLNGVLNPILIRGLLGLPAMGIRGSALATVIAQTITTLWMLRLFYTRHHLLIFRRWRLAEYLATFRAILSFAVPSILSMLLMPISASVITRIVARFGNEAVAAAGAAGRLEMFAFVVPMALGISLTPFVSQNFGAQRLDRIRRARTVSTLFALAYGGATAIGFFVFAPWMASRFSNDPKVIEVLISYIRIICFGYGMMEVHRYSGFFLTGLHRPSSATALNIVRVLVFLLPLSILGSKLFDVRGVFIARLVTDLCVGSIGLLWVARTLRITPGAVPVTKNE